MSEANAHRGEVEIDLGAAGKFALRPDFEAVAAIDAELGGIIAGALAGRCDGGALLAKNHRRRMDLLAAVLVGDGRNVRVLLGKVSQVDFKGAGAQRNGCPFNNGQLGGHVLLQLREALLHGGNQRLL